MFGKNLHANDRIDEDKILLDECRQINMEALLDRMDDILLKKLYEINGSDFKIPKVIPYDCGEDQMIQSLIYENHEMYPDIKNSYGLTAHKFNEAINYCESEGYALSDLVLTASLASLTYLQYAQNFTNLSKYIKINVDNELAIQSITTKDGEKINVNMDRVFISSSTHTRIIMKVNCYKNRIVELSKRNKVICVIECMVPIFNEYKYDYNN